MIPLSYNRLNIRQYLFLTSRNHYTPSSRSQPQYKRYFKRVVNVTIPDGYPRRGRVMKLDTCSSGNKA